MVLCYFCFVFWGVFLDYINHIVMYHFNLIYYLMFKMELCVSHWHVNEFWV